MTSNNNILVLDGSTPQLLGGIFFGEQWIHLFNKEQIHLEAIPDFLNHFIKDLSSLNFNKILFAHGPGSTLGIRLCLTILNTLQALPEFQFIEIYQYSPLYIAAAELQLNTSELFSIVTPSKQEYYYRIDCDATASKNLFQYTPIREVDAIVDTEKNIYFLPQAKIWKQPTFLANLPKISYSIEKIPILFNRATHLFVSCTTPSVFQLQDPLSLFKAWNPNFTPFE